MPDSSPPPLTRATLGNGLRVVLHPDGRLPLVAVNLWYQVGSRNERPGRTGLAHLFEHMLFQGSEHVGTNDHFRHLQSVGGVANGSTWYDRTNYYETVPADRLDLALWLESDRLGFLLPALDESKLENQRAVVLNERRQRVDNRPYGRPFERLLELLIPAEHPYHWPVIGREQDIRDATLDDVHRFFRRWYVPNNAVLTLAGEFAPAAALARVEHWFGSIPAGEPPTRTPLPLPPLAAPVVESVHDEVRLARVYLAFRTPPFGDDAWYAGSLLTALLAEGKSSPLYRDLVWDRRLAQDAGAYLYPTAELGILVAWATAKPESDPDRLAQALRFHLDAAATPADAAEMARAGNRILAAHWAEIETLEGRADRLSMATTLFDHPEAAWEEPARYSSVTAEAAAEFAASYLRSEQMVQLTVLPRSERP